MPAPLFAVFFVAFVGIGVLWIVRPRTMTKYQLRTRYGVTGDVELSDTQVRLRQVLAALVVVVGVTTMLSWGFGF